MEKRRLMRSISVLLFFFCPIILFQRVLLPFIHHLVNLLVFCHDFLCHCPGRKGILVANRNLFEMVLFWFVRADPHGCCPIQRELVPVSPQSHAQLWQTCMSSEHYSWYRIFFYFIFLFVFVFLYQGFWSAFSFCCSFLSTLELDRKPAHNCILSTGQDTGHFNVIIQKERPS